MLLDLMHRRDRIGLLFRLQLVLVMLSLFAAVRRAEATDVASFLGDYRAAVKQRAALHSSLAVEGVFVEERTRDPKVVISERKVQEIAFSRNPTHEKIQFRFTEGLKSAEQHLDVRVIVQGAERNFWLQKPDPKGNFAITMMEAPTATSQDGIGRQRTFLIDAWSNLGTYPVAKLLDSPGFRVERVEPEGEMIGVDFSFRPEEPRKALMSGHFVVDPAQGMAIRRQDIRRWALATPDKVEAIRGEAAYRMVAGIAFPDEVDLRIGPPTQPDRNHMHFHATRVSAAPVPDSAFTLEAFGLGDVDRPAPRSRFDFTYWAVGLAGVAFALSLFLKWRGRQLARATDRAAGVAG